MSGRCTGTCWRHSRRPSDIGSNQFKPFSPTELTARIRAAPRAVEPCPNCSSLQILSAGRPCHRLRPKHGIVAGRPVELTSVEYWRLGEFSVCAGQVLTNVRLLQPVSRLEVRTTVKRLRRKMGTTPATLSAFSTSLASAIGCRGGKRRVLVKDDGPRTNGVVRLRNGFKPTSYEYLSISCLL